MTKPVMSLMFFILSLTVAPAAWAKSAGSTNGSIYTEIRLNTGLLNGHSGRYRYDAYGKASGVPGHKLTQLNWTLENVPMVGVGFSIASAKWLRVSADYWTNATDSNATMDDYDWNQDYMGLYTDMSTDWSHWAHHDSTTVTKAESIDLNAEITIFQSDRKKDFDRERFTITAILGYKQDQFIWNANAAGVYGIYSNTAYRDNQNITFPEGPVVSYEQQYKIPYVGLGLNATNANQITFSARVRYSNQVQGDSIDYHYVDEARFDDSGDNGKWLSWDIKMDFHMSKALLLNAAYMTQYYSEIKASTMHTDLKTGDKTLYQGDAAGLDHHSNMLSLGLTYQF